ncbi:MAG: hypothetical protein NTV31_04845 [Bacteroidia bacterium]|nr:hypothetical protein [Bacteroidia bacterium]
MKFIIAILIILLPGMFFIQAQNSYVEYMEKTIALAETFENDLKYEIVRIEFDMLSKGSDEKICYRYLSDLYEYFIAVRPMGDGIIDTKFKVYDENNNLVATSTPYVSEEGGANVASVTMKPEKGQQYTIKIAVLNYAPGKLTGDYLMLIAHDAGAIIINSTYYQAFEKKRNKYKLYDTYYEESTFTLKGSILTHQIGSSIDTYELLKTEDVELEGSIVSFFEANNQDGLSFLICIHVKTNSIWIINPRTNWWYVYVIEN